MLPKLFSIPLFLYVFHIQSFAAGADFYVSTTGSDGNPGTLAAPFASIQHGVDQLGPGCTLYIREGRYAEEVDLSGVAGTAGQPITLTPYNGETVTFDGTEPITSAWTLDSGNIYKTTVSQDVTQLFVDGKPMTLARFPNAVAYSDLAWGRNNRLQQLVSSSNGTVIDSGGTHSLAGSGIDFTDCVGLLNFQFHITYPRLVQNHTAGSNTFDYDSVALVKHPGHYWFEGGLGNAERRMLDRAQEWAFDETTMTLYLWAANGLDPTGRDIISKNQVYALTGDETTQHVVIDGLDFFATTFRFASSDHVTIQNCELEYYASSRRSLGDISAPVTAEFRGVTTDLCENIKVFNCAFRHVDSAGLHCLYSKDALIENNLFFKTDYAPVGLAGAVNLRHAPGSVFRHNTIEMSGDAMGVVCEPTAGSVTEPWTIEYNLFTKCGQMERDGSAVYSAHEWVVESVARYNWFIDNDQRDFRWDGDNSPVLLGINANVYRNVAMATDPKLVSTGDGYRLKGDLHEIYHNVGLLRSELNVPIEKGGNANTVTRNNAADTFTAYPNIPGDDSHNFIGQDETKSVAQSLNNVAAWDFRPRPTAVELIDQGTPVTCSVNGATIDVTAGYLGTAPDIGAYEYGDPVYWIPGRIESKASMPFPKDEQVNVGTEVDLLYQLGLNGVAAHIYLGQSPSAMTLVTSLNAPENVVTLPTALDQVTEYVWRVDTELADGSIVTGDVWAFETKLETPEFPTMANRTIHQLAEWEIDATTGEAVYNNRGTPFDRRALFYSNNAYQSDNGFKFTAYYKTGNIGDSGGHNFSFGIISSDTNLGGYSGFNPFRADTSVYSLGVNLTIDQGGTRGLKFTNGSTVNNVDGAGTNVQFVTNQSTRVDIVIEPGGVWSYSIDGIMEASGVIAAGFDLSKSYRIAVYGQDDNGNGKSIQYLKLKPLDGTDYNTWEVAHFTPAEIAAGDSDPSVDYDGDGFSNQAEYSFGTDPKSSARARHFTGLKVLNGGILYQGIQYTRRNASNSPAPLVSYVIQRSRDLLGWTDVTSMMLHDPASSSPVDNGDGTETLTLYYPFDVETLPNQKLFFRVKAEE